jgi:nucleotide-binding universal stress UspA family protein
MYKKILVPLDGSTRAEKILPHVEAVAASSATIVFLQVVESSAADFALGADMMVTAQEMQVYWKALQAAEEAAKEYLAKKQTQWRRKKYKVKTLVKRGPAASVIIKTAQSEKVDLVAMASHGRSGLKRVFYGSVANGVLHQIQRPLLLIRATK